MTRKGIEDVRKAILDISLTGTTPTVFPASINIGSHKRYHREPLQALILLPVTSATSGTAQAPRV